MTIDTTPRRWKASERPTASIKGWPGEVKLTRINSKTVYYRDPHCVGEMAVGVDRLLAIREPGVDPAPSPNPRTPEEIADAILADGVDVTRRDMRRALIRAINTDRDNRDHATRIPPELDAWIEEDTPTSDYSLYVLDRQTADHTEQHGPYNTNGSCYHDVVVIVDGHDGESATKYTQEPDGQITARAI